MVEFTVAAADAYAAASINSSLIQAVQNTTALATCLGVSRLARLSLFTGLYLCL